MTNNKLTISLLVVFVAMTIFLASFVFYIFWSYQIDEIKKEIFKIINENFQTDKKVLEITEECNSLSKNSSSKYFHNKIECANDLINFQYDRNRTSKFILNPLDMSKNNGEGVCRDYSIFIKSILDNMNIESKFVYEPNHVFVEAYYKGEIYKLNNGRLIRK